MVSPSEWTQRALRNNRGWFAGNGRPFRKSIADSTNSSFNGLIVRLELENESRRKDEVN